MKIGFLSSNHPYRVLLVMLLMFCLSTPYARGEEDEMVSAIKSIWPDKDVKVLKVKDNSLGNVTLTNYGAEVMEDGYTYQVAAAVVPDNAPAETFKLMDAHSTDGKQVQLKSIKTTAWISPPRDSIFIDDSGGRRKNIYIVQRVDFKCVDTNIYVTTSVNRDKGTTEANPDSQDPNSAYTRQLEQKYSPLSTDLAERAAGAICNTGCNASEIYKFYKSYLDIDKPGFEFGENFKKGQKRAFDEYPTNCPGQTKQAMLGLINEGYDAPAKMWSVTARWNSFQEDRGTPAEYNKFIRNLGGKIGMTQPVVRRFVHYTRKKDTLYAISKKLDKPLKEILLHVMMGQVNKISGAMTENSIDAAALIMIDDDKNSLINPETIKYYVNAADFTNNSLDSKAKNHEVLIDYVEFSTKVTGRKKLESGIGIMKEALFFVPQLIEIYDIEKEYMTADRTFDELQASFPDARRDYERSLMRLSLVRYSMRDSLALWNKLQEENKGAELALWPEDDQKVAYELVGQVNRNQSYFARLLKAHGVLLEELKQNKDAFVLTWYLLGYPENTLPPMEAIY